MPDDLWVSAIQWTVWGVIMALVMGWLARSRHRKRPAVEARRLAHPPSTLIIGVVGVALFAGLAVVSNVYANETTTVWTTVIFVGFAALALPLIADYFFARHDVTDEGLHFGRLTGGRGRLRWDQVTRVRYAPAMKWFRVESRSGDVARISAMLVGLPEFARTVLAQVPPRAIDPETLNILRTTAAGNPPSLWQ